MNFRTGFNLKINNNHISHYFGKKIINLHEKSSWVPHRIKITTRRYYLAQKRFEV